MIDIKLEVRNFYFWFYAKGSIVLDSVNKYENKKATT